ncbi:glycine betaine ABC transporter substrate-binding protein [Tianweitania sp.]|uniref:glycine betaine ABC transporter substrate-binding protein n=1 Tax=Tianweitania sp. TaxID=2021634 RepID=UPI0028A1BE97|nr:glycine betaine ABC transporter substrate-binding protein [Tianweitania sp.]
MNRKHLFLAPLLLTLGLASPAMADCGEVTIANMNAQTAEALAAIDEFILTNGFGCSASQVSGDTVPAITSMIEKGQPDIIPEAALTVVPDLIKQGVDAGAIVETVDPLSGSGEQGLWVPKALVDKYPEVATLKGALAHPELFPDPEDPSKGAIYNGAQGWGSTIVTAQLFKANKIAESNFNLVDPGSLAGLDSAISRANERGTGIIAYYWSPTGLLGRYEMVKVDLGVPHDPQEWTRCSTKADCADPKPNNWPADSKLTLVSKPFAERQDPAIMDYLNKRALDRDTINELLAWMTENQAPGDVAAEHFLTEKEAVWSKWLAPDVAAKVKEAL